MERASTPENFVSAWIEAIDAACGAAPSPVAIQPAGAGVRWIGSSSLDVAVEPAAGVAGVPEAHERPESVAELEEYGVIEHRGWADVGRRIDAWTFTSTRGDEQVLELRATFAWGGAWQHLAVFSNSYDFAKGLGAELPAALTWERLVATLAEVVDAPPPDAWS
ncbi:MAG: hypothetical protein R3A79_03580 [Nannocystaceae bacterium]